MDSGGADEKKLLTGTPFAALLREALLRTDGTVTDLLELFTCEDTHGQNDSGPYSYECDWPKVNAKPGPIIRDVVLCLSAVGAVVSADAWRSAGLGVRLAGSIFSGSREAETVAAGRVDPSVCVFRVAFGPLHWPETERPPAPRCLLAATGPAHLTREERSRLVRASEICGPRRYGTAKSEDPPGARRGGEPRPRRA
jgi:hypothetical protein